jgi:2-polyprenyl-3-methyl-5-hydroxy-6-metoxy-1,4-benzoquinol methylase
VGCLQFDKEYYIDMRYQLRERLIRRYALEIIEWGSKASNCNLFNGKNKTALDVGCAYGYVTDVLKSFGYETFGVDISQHSVKQAKKICSTDFAVCDIQKTLPFKNRVFDLVICFEVLEHLENPIQAVKNMFDSCKYVMICTTPNRIVEKPIKKIVKDFDETHISLKTPREWKECLKRSLKYSLVKVEPFFDASLRAADKPLFFKSFKIPYFGLDTRILIRR